MSKKDTNLSVYMCYLLRHHPEDANLKMDELGWVNVNELINGINAYSKHKINLEKLKEIVANDSKGRYKFDNKQEKIKACQGHSVKWVRPSLNYGIKLPEFVYHGTTVDALEKIKESGYILKMERHAVHMQAGERQAWKSAKRWKGKIPVVLKISTKKLRETGILVGVTENNVWCADRVPIECITEEIRSIQ